MQIKVGVDLVNIARIERLLKKYPERFIKKVLSKEEAELFKARGAKAETLAAAFAAKEAVLKALGCGIGPAGLAEVEVLSPAGKEPLVKLSGQAAQIAQTNKVSAVAVSMSHDAPYACAVAAAY